MLLGHLTLTVGVDLNSAAAAAAAVAAAAAAAVAAAAGVSSCQVSIFAQEAFNIAAAGSLH